MALIFCDSFDHYATAERSQKWNTVTDSSSLVSISAGNGRNSTQSCRFSITPIGPVTHHLKKGFTSVTTAIVGVGFKTSSLDIHGAQSTSNILAFMYDTVANITVHLTSAGAIAIYKGENATLLGTTNAGLLSNDVYAYIEVKVLFSDTVGTVDVRVDGVSVLALTVQDTIASGTVGCDNIRLGYTTSSSFYTLTCDWDDIYIANTSGSYNTNFIGPIRVKAILPDGAGNSTDFTPSAGSNYQNVDEASTDGDTTYNSETTAGDHDTYTYAAVGVTGVVKAVQTNLVVRSDGAGAETIAPMVRIGGTDYQGTTAAVTTSYADNREIFEVSPATAVVWTVTEIDGAEFGIKLVS